MADRTAAMKVSLARSRGFLCLTVLAFTVLGAPRPEAATRPQSDPAVVAGDAAKDLLLKFLERSRYVKMTSIAEQPLRPGSKESMQLKIVQDEKGRRCSTVLQPLFMQGVKSIDDGKRWINYYPDEARLIVQDAPDKSTIFSPRARLDLAEKNYSFALEKGPAIAGKACQVVVAVPKAPEIPTRRFSIEVTRCVLLRLETKLRSEPTRLLFDTKAITFPAKISSDLFELKPVGAVQTVTVTAPKSIDSSVDVKALVGFEPVLPKAFPYGFVPRKPEITGDDTSKMVVVQLTDGLAYATVYQFGSGSALAMKDPSLERLINGLRIKIVTDLPAEIGQRLLDVFAKEATKALGSLRELSERSRALNGQNSQAKAPAASRSKVKDAPKEADEGLAPVLIALLAALKTACEDVIEKQESSCR